MPIYEYECSQCGHHTEVLQRFSDPPVTKCDRCHASMKKIMSQSTFHLKGSGWYVTDYARKSSPDATDSGSEKKTEAPSEAKSEKKSKKPDKAKESTDS